MKRRALFSLNSALQKARPRSSGIRAPFIDQESDVFVQLSGQILVEFFPPPVLLLSSFSDVVSPGQSSGLWGSRLRNQAAMISVDWSV